MPCASTRTGGVVRVVEAVAGLGGGGRGVLAREHEVVQRALRAGGELAVGRERCA